MQRRIASSIYSLSGSFHPGDTAEVAGRDWRCAVHSEGTCLIALVNGKTVQVWDAQKQHLSFPPLGHDSPVNHVRFSDDGKLSGWPVADPKVKVAVR